ncbi:hypothetical protein LWI28_024352 [Acer negundo]|uniref:S-protein homolog n=1 Tax=Acer negundo TaxID=4023 RepID=A0AAD5IVW3_ACENE|nr:hypothetical protein LWI28_010881 [Acer negundo]KAI9178250.1 hypothetical protein LWI28_024352 [Acer negundo]
MRISMTHLSGLILILIVLLVSTCDAQNPFQKVRVVINNEIGAGIDLKIHCKSKDDDLGEHVIPYGGNYDFKFTPNYFGYTLYFCGFSWQNQFHIFDIYETLRDYKICDKTCPWFVKSEGPCLFDGKESGMNICYKWK